MKLIANYCVILLLILTSKMLMSCDASSKNNFNAEQNSADVSKSNKLTKVDVETAQRNSLSSIRQYKGTTQPQRKVSWRAQTEGILLELSVEVGDIVNEGQLIGKIDSSILSTDVAEKIGELTALQSELAQAEIRITNARIQLQEAEIQLEQARSEAVRYQNLAKTGLIAQQQAESYVTAAKIAEKSLLTAQETIKLEQKAVAIVEGRIAAQEAAISESKQRQNYSQITAPINGILTAKAKEVGTLVRTGEEVITIGDFSQIKVVVPLSELDLGKVNVGQQVDVEFDAFGDRQFRGKVSRIAPTTNPSSRQIPVEITVNNPDNQIKGGLLARVSLAPNEEPTVVVPEIAIVQESGIDYIFTITKQDDKQSTVNKQKVVLGDRINGKAEVIAGISPGEKYVLRSSKPLKDSDLVSLSIISE